MNQVLLRLKRYDERILRAIVRRRRRYMDFGMRLITRLGNALPILGFTSTMILLPGMRLAGLHAAVALTFAQAMSHSLKHTIRRKRPCDEGVTALAAVPNCSSFPSGHASATLVIGISAATALAGAVAWIPVSLALLVGFSRAYVGVHYPLDVLAGWSLAVLSSVAANAVL